MAQDTKLKLRLNHKQKVHRRRQHEIIESKFWSFSISMKSSKVWIILKRKTLHILREKFASASSACVDLSLLGARAALNLAAPDESAFAVQLGEGHAALVALVAA
jgi:hypothetical protein